MRGARIAAALLMTVTAAAATGCQRERDSTGVCTGDMDGEIYYLQILNFVAAKTRIFVSGREIGHVGGYDEEDHVPDFQDFGYMPQCSDAGIGFAGSDDTYIGELSWTVKALEVFPDRCAVEIHLLRAVDEYPEDWIEYGMRLPGNYSDVGALSPTSQRDQCPPWKWYFEINEELPLGTPTPSANFRPEEEDESF